MFTQFQLHTNHSHMCLIVRIPLIAFRFGCLCASLDVQIKTVYMVSFTLPNQSDTLFGKSELTVPNVLVSDCGDK